MDIELKHGFKYHHDNEEVEAKFITISAFTMKQMGMVAPVKEIVMKAQGNWASNVDISIAEIEEAEAAEKAKSDAEEEAKSVDSKQMMAIIAMNCEAGDLPKFYAYMQKLLTCGVAYIDASNVKFSGVHINDINPEDFENLCGEYVGNFIN